MTTNEPDIFSSSEPWLEIPQAWKSFCDTWGIPKECPTCGPINSCIHSEHVQPTLEKLLAACVEKRVWPDMKSWLAADGPRFVFWMLNGKNPIPLARGESNQPVLALIRAMQAYGNTL